MRNKVSNNNISVRAIAGTEVVILGLNATEEGRKGLLGFTILRRKGNSGKFRATGSNGFRFAETSKSKRVNSRHAPTQSFMWSDYSVKIKTKYTYRIIPRYNKPTYLKKGISLDITITTEDPNDKTHGVFFNYGIAGSQSYSAKFKKYLRWYLSRDSYDNLRAKPFIKPSDVPKNKAYKFLSSGLEEAMGSFIEQAKDSNYTIRAAVYEFTHVPIIKKFVAALERGVDVKIIHHAKRKGNYILKYNKSATTTVKYDIDQKNSIEFRKREGVREEVKDSVLQAADDSLLEVGLTTSPYDKKFYKLRKAYDEMMIERTITQISHNKFIILLHKGKPIKVWTGSTNFTPGGIYGQSNVGHMVRDEKVAKKYFEYWKKLSTDPIKKSKKNDPTNLGMQNWTVNKQPVLKGPPPANSITPVFSPRLKPKTGEKDMLDWYADMLAGANHSVFLTSAFSVCKQFINIVKDVKKSGKIPSKDNPYLRYLLLEGKGGLLKDKYPIMKKCPQNRVAHGDLLKKRTNEDEHYQHIETLTGLNDHVNYLHTKYMLIDPLSEDPIVISGSANFSDASTHANDENMLIIRGNTRVADIFLTEFMRLFHHFEFRNIQNSYSDAKAKKSFLLTSDDSWTEPYYLEGNPKQQERLLFNDNKFANKPFEVKKKPRKK